MVAMPPKIEVLTEDEAYAVADAFQQLIHAATYADTTSTALQKRLTNQLRADGLDAHMGGLRASLLGSDAQRTAARAVQPLRAIAVDLTNVSRNAVLLRRRVQSLVFDPIREARRMQSSGTNEGIKVA